MLTADDIESLERSVVAGVAPERVVELEGWLAPIDGGPIGRARSAVPLRHEVAPDRLGALDNIEQAYERAARPPRFRVAETEGLSAVRTELMLRGYRPDTPTIMKVGDAGGLIALGAAPADLLPAPDAAWAACFNGDGFDPIEGAGRIRNLSRAPDALFGAVREGERTVAVGVVTFSLGWAAIHGMRTAPEHRGRGLASRVLTTLGRAAATRGIDRVLLQVKEENPARSLYRKAGFRYAWRYEYWGK